MHRVTYYNDVTIEDIPDGQTLLDASIRNRIPHLHQCGGRGRCTTCRVQILDGISHVSPRNPIEQKVVNQRGWDEFTRLACQTKVHGAVVIRRLLDNPQDIIVLDLDELQKERSLSSPSSSPTSETSPPTAKKTCPTTWCTC
jgi:ferredoxin